MASDTHPNAYPHTLNLISTCTPASLSRAWFSAPHPTHPLVASCSSDKTVRIYSLASFALLSTIGGGHKRSIRTCAWKPGLKGESILATGSFDASVGIWRHDDEPLHQTEMDFTTGLAGGSGDKGDGDDDDDDEEEWRFALVLDGHDSEVKSVAWSAGGNLLATCGRDKSVWIWEEVGTDDYETVAVLQEHTGDVKSVAWHPEEELLASGAYDDDVRLWRETADDWECVALLPGHAGTVWTVTWENPVLPMALRSAGSSAGGEEEDAPARAAWRERRAMAGGGARLASCSADGSIRIWRRLPRRPGASTAAQSALSIIRTDSHMEEWTTEATLPTAHAGAIYSIAWSARTGLLASTGDDGNVVVYAERWKPSLETSTDVPMADAAPLPPPKDPNQQQQEQQGAPNGEQIPAAKETEAEPAKTQTQQEQEQVPPSPMAATEWTVLAVLEGAHDVFEVNHVVWARRADPGRSHTEQKNSSDEDVEVEEVLVTTADDGAVKVWEFR